MHELTFNENLGCFLLRDTFYLFQQAFWPIESISIRFTNYTMPSIKYPEYRRHIRIRNRLNSIVARINKELNVSTC